ncbi:MAG TPA: hypothetical protein VFQ79_23560 [Bryobacteraceae bacterium]|nr:hypothetical protein [Bryobacteraceae bacterium]
MKKVFLSILVAATAAFAQYTSEAAGAPPAEASALAGVLQSEGVKISGSNGPAMEFWFVKEMPGGATAPEENATLTEVPHGAFLGVVSFPAAGQDRRGQQIKPGVYTIRYSLFPIDGAHQGVEPQRDFFVLSPAATDQDPAAKPDYETLMKMSLKASGTPHPLVFSFWKEDTGAKPGLTQEGETWVLRTNIGSTLVGIIVVGVHAG